jgi:hypothetical protein
MNKIVSNIRYIARWQFIWMAFSFGIIVTSMFFVFYPLIKFSVINSTHGSLVYRCWVLVIIEFALAMRFKEDFDFLLTLSNTRIDIFLSQLCAASGLSVFISGLIILERRIVDYLNTVFRYDNITDPFHFIAPYHTDNLFWQFVYFFMLCACCSTFGLMMGSFFYRFGKKFTLVFWLMFSTLPVVLFPLFLWNSYQPEYPSRGMSTMKEFLINFDLTAGSGYLLLLAIVFTMGAYLNIRRLPQK